jgi:hypothetical protein
VHYRRFYHDRLGLDPLEDRDGGLRYVCECTEFHLFASAGSRRGVDPAWLRRGRYRPGRCRPSCRWLRLETLDTTDLSVTDQVVTVPNNYSSKGTGDRGAFFYDSEGNLLAIGQAIRLRSRCW